MSALALSLTFCFQIISSQYTEWDSHFDHKAFVTPQENFQIYWTSNIKDCTIEFGMIVETNGWAAIGISMTGGMSKSDIVMGYVDDEGEVTLENWYRDLPDNGWPTPFQDQSGIRLIDGWKDDINGTTKKYLRFMKDTFPSLDRNFSIDIPIGTARVIYAWNDNLPFGYHGEDNRGTESMNLLSGDSKEIPLPEDAAFFDVLQPNVSVPSTDTTYWCTLLPLPTFNKTQHVVRFDPVIQAGNEGIVHHILLSICPEKYVDHNLFGAPGFDCDEMANMATNASHCRGGLTMYVWAVGGKSFYFPENVGLEMGGPEEDAIKYVLLETHFDNPTETAGFLDSSGLRIWYTPTLRDESAAVISVADGYDQYIPPGFVTKNYAFMTGECSENGFPEDGVKIIANFYHQHLLGRAGLIRHIRDGKELKPIDVNEAYDFDYQQMVPVQEEILLLPGDEIIVECTIDSREREEMTYGGESTRDEMCVHYMIVYPKPINRGTFSSFDWAEKAQFINDSILMGYINETTGIYDVNVDGAIEFYEQFQNSPLRRIGCIDSMNEPIGDFQLLPIPQDFEEYNMENYIVCGDEEEENVEKSPEEIQLEAEIRAIELDSALIDLRRELQAQEELLERWEESIRKLKEEREEAEIYRLHTDEDRQDERALKADFRQAQESVALLRERVQQLEALRADR